MMTLNHPIKRMFITWASARLVRPGYTASFTEPGKNIEIVVEEANIHVPLLTEEQSSQIPNEFTVTAYHRCMDIPGWDLDLRLTFQVQVTERNRNKDGFIDLIYTETLKDYHLDSIQKA